MTRPAFPSGVYPILDESLAPDRPRAELARELLLAGARVIQVRMKSSEGAAFYAVAQDVRSTIPGGALLIINDRADIAGAVGANGVHVGQDDLPVAAARTVLHPDALIGLSTHSLEQALHARTLDVDYIGFGPIYATATKPDALSARGPDLLHEVVQAVAPLHVVAIGGISRDTLPGVAATGAAGAAVITALAQPDIGRAFRELAHIWKNNSLKAA